MFSYWDARQRFKQVFVLVAVVLGGKFYTPPPPTTPENTLLGLRHLLPVQLAIQEKCAKPVQKHFRDL